jgi:hypothetical protein
MNNNCPIFDQYSSKVFLHCDIINKALAVTAGILSDTLVACVILPSIRINDELSDGFK